MAVDANVIIFERLKDEIRSGKGIHSALEAVLTVLTLPSWIRISQP